MRGTSRRWRGSCRSSAPGTTTTSISGRGSRGRLCRSVAKCDRKLSGTGGAQPGWTHLDVELMWCNVASISPEKSKPAAHWFCFCLMEHILFKSRCLDLWITEELKHEVSINNARLIDHVHQSGTHSINPSAARSSLTLKGTCQQKKSSTFLIVIFFNISRSHVSLSCVCFLIGLDLLFLTAKRLRGEAGGR